MEVKRRKTMDWKKLVNLLSVKNWVQTFVLKTVVNKVVKHATSFLTGALASVLFTAKIKPILDASGIVIDPVALATSIGGATAGATGWLLNWVIKVLDKDGDGYIG